jgi:hypothetical protein
VSEKEGGRVREREREREREMWNIGEREKWREMWNIVIEFVSLL